MKVLPVDSPENTNVTKQHPCSDDQALLCQVTQQQQQMGFYEIIPVLLGICLDDAKVIK